MNPKSRDFSKSPFFERLENRCVMSGVVPFTVGVVTLPTDPSVNVSGDLAQQGVQQLYSVTLDTQGLLTAAVQTSGVGTLLSLENAQGKVLIQSEGSSPSNPADQFAQHLPAGQYYLSVQSQSGPSNFSLSTSFTPALPAGQAIAETQGAYEVTTSDLTGNGKTDLIVPDYFYNQVLINYGVGDGTFQPPVAIPVGVGPTDVLAVDLFGNGHIDLVVVDQLSNDLTILKGDGAGNFSVSQVIPTRSGPVSVVAGDFSGDGRLDLAVASNSSNGVEIFHHQADGSFVESNWIGNIDTPTSLAIANLSNNGGPDLLVSSGGSGSVSLLHGEGNDQFSAVPYTLPVGPDCASVIAFNEPGSTLSEIAAVSTQTGIVSIFEFDGFAYRLKQQLVAGKSPKTLVAADFNADGKLDLAAVNYGSNNVSVFLATNNDTFSGGSTFDTGAGPFGLASGDFNGDGHADIVTTDSIGLTVSVLLNNGDATFASPPLKPPSAGPQNVVVADLTGNGIQDLIVPDVGLNAVEIFLGRGDGTFRDPILVPAGTGPEDVAVGDFTGDGIPDLAVADYYSNSILILKGNGDGTFAPIETLKTGDGPEFIKTGDLAGDGHLDLVVSNYLGNSIDLFYGSGNGTFSAPVSYPVGLGPGSPTISDLNGDGRLDIVIPNSGSNDIFIMMATGGRSYAPPVIDPAGVQPWFVRAGDFSKNGHPDLVVSDGLSAPSVVSILINNGDGTFQPPVGYGVGGGPYPLVIGDFTGNGNLDVVTGNDVTNDLSFLEGNGNGTFAPEVRLPSGIDPYGLAVGHFTSDGNLDLVAVNFQSSTLSVYLGHGDGTFDPPSTVPLVSPDLLTITANLEGNGVPQVLVANPINGTITVFNSQGDGTLQLITSINVGGSPSGMVVGDFNGDGRPDLAVTDSTNGEVLILLGLGNGTFQTPIRYMVGKSPQSPVVGDFKRNGILDIAVADTGSNEISVLIGNGDGTFQPAASYPSGVEPISMVVGYANQTGLLDLGTVNRTSQNLTEFFGSPDGTFTPATVSLQGLRPTAMLEGDFNGDGQNDLLILDGLDGAGVAYIDIASPQSVPIPFTFAPGHYLASSADLYNDGKSELILANTDTNVITVYSDWRNNSFQTQTSFQADVAIAGISFADLNSDGSPDILITESGTGNVQTYLSGGNGVFSPAESTVALPHPVPIVFPLGTPGLSDIVNVDKNGTILNRMGLVGSIAQFAAPIDETNGTGISVRDTAIVQTGGDPIVASLDNERPIVYLHNIANPSTTDDTLIHLPVQGVYTRLVSGDLFGHGRDDLIVINRTLDEIFIFEQVSAGVFQQYGSAIAAGFGPTDVTLANLDPGGMPDLVITDGSSGTVTVIGRNSSGGFFDQATLAAGLATAGTVVLGDGLNRTSPDQPVGVTSGVFGPSGLTDVVVVDHGTNRISVLQGLPGGGLSAPSLAMTYSTGLDPIEIIAAPLTSSGLLDLVVLNEGSHDISIFLNNGQGGFTVLPRVDAGDSPASFTVSDVTGDGVPDLVVSNLVGDILILAGNGNGTFQPYERADGTVNLAVGDLTGSGQNDFVLTNTAQDLLSVQTSSNATGFVQGRGNGLLAPGPVSIADMNGDGIPDLIVTNTGGNDVLVYLGLGGGQFAAPQEFFTGTAPVGLTVANLTKNRLPDLIVANSGSNDITILIGSMSPNGDWTMVPGPRLKAGYRPVSTTVADLYGTGEQDLIVVNQGNNDISILRGLGGGFFDDTHALNYPVGDSPVQAFVGHFSDATAPGIVVLNSQSNDMTYFSTITAPSQTIPSGGVDPIAGVTGSFDNSGYTDLAVANNGDSRITVFDGSATGLRLDQTILLGASTHPTGLVVTTTQGNGVQFYVGASGQDHAISVTYSSSTTIISIGPTTMDGGLVASYGSSRTSTNNPSNLGTNSSTFFEPPGAVANAQSQELAFAGASGGGSTGTVSLAAAMVTTLTIAAQPLFSPSSRTLGWLLDNLVQLAQGQTAEILPLGKNEMAAVAVLLSSSSLGSPVEERGRAESPIPTEDDPPVVALYIPDESNVKPPSPLDRYVARLDASSLQIPEEILNQNIRTTDFGADWVWRRKTLDDASLTATFEVGPEITVGTRQEVPLGEPSNRDAPEFPIAESRLETLEEPPALGVSRIATIAGTILVSAVGLSLVYLLRLRISKQDSVHRIQHAVPRPNGNLMRDSTRDRSNVSLSRSKIRQDLPPWLQGPMGAKHGPSKTGRCNGTLSLFRKSSLKD